MLVVVLQILSIRQLLFWCPLPDASCAKVVCVLEGHLVVADSVLEWGRGGRGVDARSQVIMSM